MSNLPQCLRGGYRSKKPNHDRVRVHIGVESSSRVLTGAPCGAEAPLQLSRRLSGGNGVNWQNDLKAALALPGGGKPDLWKLRHQRREPKIA